jgi:hypothetical protein
MTSLILLFVQPVYYDVIYTCFCMGSISMVGCPWFSLSVRFVLEGYLVCVSVCSVGDVVQDPFVSSRILDLLTGLSVLIHQIPRLLFHREFSEFYGRYYDQ